MAIATYNTDLTDINADTTGETWVEMTNMAGQGAIEEAETDFPIEGTYHASQICTKSSTLGSACFDKGSDISGSFDTYDCVFVWQTFLPAAAVDTFANGGLRIIVGADASTWSAWKTGGNDFGRYPYGGWQNTVVWPSFTADYDNGGGHGGAYRFFGSGINVVSGIGKGSPHGVDIIRYGRGEIITEYGDTGVATFADMAAENDSNRWGLFQKIAGGYLWKGLMTLGTSSNEVYFTDANVNITIDNCLRTFADFCKIEINNADSEIYWTNVNITALVDDTYGSLSIGVFEVVDDAIVELTGCVFTDMGAFTFDSNSVLDNCTWRRCGIVTQGGGSLTGCLFDESAAAKALVADDITSISGCDFVSDGTGYAIEGFSAAGSYTLNNLTFTGYASSDGSTGNEALHVLASSGTVTIYYTGAAPSVHSAGATIVKVGDSVDITVTVKTTEGVLVENARVFVKASNDTGPFPYQESVTIVNSGTTATVAHTGHGMATNDYVVIEGASLQANNGVFQITVNGVDEYEYTMSSTPGSSPTGAITSTFVALYGLSNSSGIVTTSREYGDDQPVSGWARKSTSVGQLYKPGPISETIDAENGMTTSAILIADE